MSLLDYMIISSKLVNNIKSLQIDSELKFTPFRQKNGTLKYPDHFALFLELVNLPITNKCFIPPSKFTTWNTKKSEGWETYKRETEHNHKLNKLAMTNTDDPESLLRGIEKEMNNLKYKCFGKVKVSTKDHHMKEVEKLQKLKVKQHLNNMIPESENDAIDSKMAEVLKTI